jgi:hypothetical protein
MTALPRGWEDGLHVGDARTSRHLQTFRFEIPLADDPRAQGLTAGIDFRWEARQR